MSADYSKWLLVSDIDGTLNNKLRRLPQINKTKIHYSFGECYKIQTLTF